MEGSGGVVSSSDGGQVRPCFVAAGTAEVDRATRRARVTELASHIHAAEAEMVQLIADLDADEAWAGPGYLSLAHWLGVNAGYTPAQAMRTLAIYRRLDHDGPDPEPELEPENSTWLRKWWDDESRLHLDGCLDTIDGARFEAALDAAKALGERDADDAARRITATEALSRMAEVTLDDATTRGVTRDGTHFAVEVVFDLGATSARLDTSTSPTTSRPCCDSRCAPPQDATPHVTSAQRRALRLRDGGCAFPGCGQTRFLHAHHIVFWEHGGRTDLDNLVLLCQRHHRLLHHGQYSCRLGPDTQRPRFTDPNGRELPTRGPTPDVVTPLLAWHQRQRERRIDPGAARCRSGGEAMTSFALDVILHNLLTAPSAA